MMASSESPVKLALVMYAPGAKVKMHDPTLLEVARASELVVAPTAKALGAEDGLYEQESPPLLFPAAETTLMLLCVGNKTE